MPVNFKSGLKTLQRSQTHQGYFHQYTVCHILSFRQYISNVGEEEKYNIKELITAKNSVVPYLTEQDILEVLFGPQSEMKP